MIASVTRRLVKRNSRLGWSLLLLIASLTLLVLLIATVGDQSAPGELGPRFWPKFWLAVMLLLTALDAAVAFRVHNDASADTVLAARDQKASLFLLLSGMALVILYAIGTVLIGFALATMIFLVAFSYLGGYRHMRSLPLIAAGATLALLYVFVYFVYISLPLGSGAFVEMNVLLYRLLGLF